MTYEKFTRVCDLASKVCAVGLAAALVLSTAATVILFHLAILFSLLSGNWREKFNSLVRNPILFAFLFLFLSFLIGSIYSTATMTEVLIALRKYSKYLLAIILLPVFAEEKWRNYSVLSFMLGISVSLIASYLVASGWLHYGATGLVEVFKMSMVFNGLMAFAAYICLLKIQSTTSYYRLLWITFLVLIAYTILFRSIGRSGYFVFAGLMLLFFIQKFHWRGFVIATTGVTLLCGLAFTFSSTFKERMNTAFNEVKTYQKNDNTSVGLRITFVRNSIQLIKAHPIFGTGTGSYFKEYNAINPHNEFTQPHNEYIHIMVQLGVFGLIILILFFAIPLWYSKFLLENEKYIARGIIVAVMIGSLANCWLSDVTLRYCYAYFVILAFATLPSSISLSSRSAIHSRIKI